MPCFQSFPIVYKILWYIGGYERVRIYMPSWFALSSITIYLKCDGLPQPKWLQNCISRSIALVMKPRQSSISLKRSHQELNDVIKSSHISCATGHYLMEAYSQLSNRIHSPCVRNTTVHLADYLSFCSLDINFEALAKTDISIGDQILNHIMTCSTISI